MTDTHPLDPPSPFVEEWVSGLTHLIPEPRRALDVATGRGRHTLLLAAAGFRVFGVDVNLGAVRDGLQRASRQGHIVRGWCADLTAAPLPTQRFELIVVTRYLQRDLCASLASALVPGGFVLYETFTAAQRSRGLGPTSAAHLLRPGELPSLFRELETVYYGEVADADEDALARLVARRRRSPS